MTEEVLGKKPLHNLERVRFGVTRMVVLVLVVVIVVGGVVGAYVVLRPPSLSPSSSPSPTPTLTPTPTPTPTSAPSSTPTPTPTPSANPTSSPTPTPSPVPLSHTVDWMTMVNYQTDYWNNTITNPYEVTLNDSMTVSSGYQWLSITAYGTSSLVWSVVFINQTYCQCVTAIPGAGGYHDDNGFLNCNNGLVQVVVSSTAITYIGTTSHVVSVGFTGLASVQTLNDDGTFNGGELDMTLMN